MESMFSDIKVLVVGDVALDSYIYGDTDRISGEAPVVIVDINKRVNSPGCAANVAVNIANLGAKCSLIGRIGYDSNGTTLSQLIWNQGINFQPIKTLGSPTITKTRVISKHQQLLRFDEEDIISVDDVNEILLCKEIERVARDCDIIIISDYGKGFCSDDICKTTIRVAKENRIKVLVDPKGIQWEKYKGAYLISPNVKELAQICECTVNNDDDEDVIEVGRGVYDDYNMDYLLVTRSERGATLINEEIEHHIPAVSKEIFDVSGAGDTMIGVLAVCLARGGIIRKAIDIAIKAAGIVIGKVGTTPITYEELFKE